MYRTQVLYENIKYIQGAAYFIIQFIPSLHFSIIIFMKIWIKTLSAL